MEIVIWSVVEAGLAITAGSLACVRPLFKLALQRLGLSTSEDPFPARSSHYALPDGTVSHAATTRRSHRTTMYNSSELLSTRKGEEDPEEGLGGGVYGGAGGGGGGKNGEMIPMRNIPGRGPLSSPIEVKVEQGDHVSDREGSQAESRTDSSHTDTDRREPTTHFV